MPTQPAYPCLIPCPLPPGLGGLTYWLTIYPVDCIKSAMQTDSIIRSERKYTTFLGTARVGVGRMLGWRGWR